MNRIQTTALALCGLALACQSIESDVGRAERDSLRFLLESPIFWLASVRPLTRDAHVGGVVPWRIPPRRLRANRIRSAVPKDLGGMV